MNQKMGSTTIHLSDVYDNVVYEKWDDLKGISSFKN
jgi:hypothetical protein